MLGSLFAFVSNGLIAAYLFGAAIPGTHRVITPESFGMVEIAPRIWTDAPTRGPELLNLVSAARTQVGTFFGDAPASPTMILCSKQACATAFGIGGNGLSMADVAVMVSPGGLTLGTLTHELTHSRLHRKMGLRNIVQQPYPTWFDEGLATHLADHPKWVGRITQNHRNRILEIEHSWQLADAFDELGVGRTYRGAAMEVAKIESNIGRAGLLELIARAEAGERFETVLTELRSR
ncbi:hypothetical protein N9L47_03845 [Rhodobacteraceae bacterium]|nr:hypothetical protein [Paracoccaceae bacterium]